MPALIFIPRCHICREQAAVVDHGKYLCGGCFLDLTRRQLPVAEQAPKARAS